MLLQWPNPPEAVRRLRRAQIPALPPALFRVPAHAPTRVPVRVHALARDPSPHLPLLLAVAALVALALLLHGKGELFPVQLDYMYVYDVCALAFGIIFSTLELIAVDYVLFEDQFDFQVQEFIMRTLLCSFLDLSMFNLLRWEQELSA